MTPAETLVDTLSRMIDLLRSAGRENWVTTLETCRARAGDDVQGAARQVLSLFGGMGSLNDLILYRAQRPLIAENVELDALRERLHHACRQALQGQP